MSTITQIDYYPAKERCINMVSIIKPTAKVSSPHETNNVILLITPTVDPCPLARLIVFY